MITLRIYTTYDILSKQTGLQLNEQNLEYWRTRSQFKEFHSYEKDSILFLEKNIDEQDLYNHLKTFSQFNVTYELIRR